MYRGLVGRGVPRVRVMMLAVSAVVLAFASPAFAAEHHPTGNFANFKDCPLSNSATDHCIYAKTEKGEFVVGKKTVPIKNVITLQGGFHQVENSEGELVKLEFIGAENGETLSKTPQVVPGGLLAAICELLPGFLRSICEEYTTHGLSEIKATTELAAPASSIELSVQNLIEEEGTALSLPVKIHLENLFLGSSCYIGSNAHPIVIKLTTGKSGSQTGRVGKVEFLENFELSRIKENKLVNNTFKVEGAEGCDGIFSFLVDPVVNSQLGIPAGEGKNTAILEGQLEDARAEAVKKSE
jgi:hypothetical protein